MIRAFTAISIPPEIVEALGRLIGEVDRLGLHARLSRPEAIHLTLKFLGNIEETRVLAVTEKLQEVASSSPPFGLRIRNLGVFPRPSQPRVVWVGIDAGDELAELQRKVETSLESLGFDREDRPFKPHLTLARIKSRRGIARLLDFLDQNRATVDLGELFVRDYHLFQSELKPQGAVYTRLHTFPLEGS